MASASKFDQGQSIDQKEVSLLRVFLRAFLIVSTVTAALSLAVWVVLRNILSLNSEDAGTATAIIESVSAIVGALLVVYQLRADSEGEAHGRMVEQQRFLFEYNKAFIENPDMARVESSLEAYDRGEVDACDLITVDNRQSFVNYLVYLEGLAPLVLEDIMEFGVIDDLMAYRFYLAVNNPVVQREELFVWPEYYLGCYELYRAWTDYRKELGLEVLHEDRSPLDAWSLYPQWLSIARGRTPEQEVGHPHKSEYGSVAELLLRVDPYIYPQLFEGADLPRAMSRLAHAPGSPFAPEHVYVVREEGKVCALMVALANAPARPFEWTALSDPSLRLPETYETVCERYIAPMFDSVDKDEAYIACLATSPEARGRGLATKLMEAFFPLAGDRPIVLDVLADNEDAVRLYERMGFVEVSRGAGFACGGEPPVAIRMRREPWRG